MSRQNILIITYNNKDIKLIDWKVKILSEFQDTVNRKINM